VLSGGELPALVVIDAVARLMDGALNDARSSAEESFADGLLDWPHYTRPEQFAGLRVPEVLTGGDHERIRRWRLSQALGRTWRRRPDLLLGRRTSTAEEIELLNGYLQERRNEK
jgi:tRNA (guanine37-N1)-methyltransferase